MQSSADLRPECSPAPTRGKYAQDAEFVPPTLSSDRALCDMLIKEINDRRVELQWAADAALAYTDPLNEDIRRAFHLPLDRPFNG